MPLSSAMVKTVRKVTLEEQGTDFAFWQRQPYEKRLATLEEIRSEYHAWKEGTESSNMFTSPDLREFIALLNESGVRYLIVGGYAVAFHGHPRYTKDLDLWLELDEENAARLLQVLKQFGFGSLELQSADFLEPGTIVQLGHPPNRIGLLIEPTGMDFADAYAGRIEEEIASLKMVFINLEHLRLMKRQAGRLRDLDDLENLQ